MVIPASAITACLRASTCALHPRSSAKCENLLTTDSLHVLARMRFPCWCFLFARLFSFATSDHVSREDQLHEEGINTGRRTGRLYCRVGIGFHLQIHPDGRVNGSHEPSQLSLLELFAISQGVVGIRGALSRRFLSMNKKGRLHAIEEFTDDCKFRERFQDSSYNTYSSLMHRNHRSGKEWFVALNKRGKAKMGSSPSVKSQHASTHFLPRFNLPEKSHWGFTIMDKSKESHNSPQPMPPKATAPVLKVDSGQKRTQRLKYWPKFRFG